MEAIFLYNLDLNFWELSVTRVQQYIVLSAKEHTTLCGKNKAVESIFI